MPQETATQKAMEMTLLDAIERGHAKPEELIAYMATEAFEVAVSRYRDMLTKEFTTFS